MDHNPTDFIFLTSFKTDLTKSTESCHLSLFTNKCVFWKWQTTLQRDWLTMLYWKLMSHS